MIDNLNYFKNTITGFCVMQNKIWRADYRENYSFARRVNFLFYMSPRRGLTTFRFSYYSHCTPLGLKSRRDVIIVDVKESSVPKIPKGWHYFSGFVEKLPDD